MILAYCEFLPTRYAFTNSEKHSKTISLNTIHSNYEI